MMEKLIEPRLINDKDARAIVDAVRCKTKWDDEAVCEFIEDAGCSYKFHLSLTKNYRFKSIAVELAKLSTSLKKAISILSQKDVSEAIYEDLGDAMPIDDLRKLSAVVEKKLSSREMAILDSQKSVLFKHSPFEWLVGRYLARSFEQIFEQEPTCSISRLDGQPDGPFIRFCHVSLEKLGIDNGGKAYKKGAIAEAFNKVRASSL